MLKLNKIDLLTFWLTPRGPPMKPMAEAISIIKKDDFSLSRTQCRYLKAFIKIYEKHFFRIIFVAVDFFFKGKGDLSSTSGLITRLKLIKSLFNADRIKFR